MRAPGGIRRALDREAVAVVCGLALAAIALTPRNAAALTGLLAAVGAPLALALLRPRAGQRLERSTLLTLAAFAGAAALLAMAGLFAKDPRVSVFGLVGQHSGALLWLALAATAVSVAMRSRPGDAGRVARAVGASGAVLGVAALLDRAGLFSDLRMSDKVSGILENSNSLSQALVIGAACAAAWAIERRGGERALAAACAVLAGAGLVVANTNAAWLGVAVASVVAGAFVCLPAAWRARPGVAAGVLTAGCAVALAGAWLLLARGDSGLLAWIVTASNGRTGIWVSAFAQASRHLVFGKGPEQFTSWVQWSSTPGVDFKFVSTGDPHNVMLYWLLGAGVPGIAAFLAAVFLGLRGLLGRLADGVRRPGPAAMVAGVLAWGVTVTLSWTGPLGALMTALAVGALLGVAVAGPADAEAPPHRGRILPAGTVAFAVVAIAAVAWSARLVPAEYAKAADLRDGTTDSRALAAAAMATGDPSMASAAVRGYMADATADPASAGAALEAASGLRPVLEADATWNVDVALDLHDIAVERGRAAGRTGWAAVEAALAAGKQADPASGLWDYVGAAEASGFHEPAAAREHAKAALEFPQSPAVRTWLEKKAK